MILKIEMVGQVARATSLYYVVDVVAGFSVIAYPAKENSEEIKAEAEKVRKFLLSMVRGSLNES